MDFYPLTPHFESRDSMGFGDQPFLTGNFESPMSQARNMPVVVTFLEDEHQVSRRKFRNPFDYGSHFKAVS
jgi:hypothetical protein